MCIIVYSKPGVQLPTKEILSTCFLANPDGAGLMFKRDGETDVTIRKGMMTFQSFWDKYEELCLTQDDEVCYHFRIKTAGLTNAANCHPFPVTKDVDLLRATDVICENAMAHNGIFGKGEGDLSDTMIFVRDILAEPPVINNIDNDAIWSLLDTAIDTSRVIVMGSKGTFKFGGKWSEDNGILYSNDGYKTRRFFYSGEFRNGKYHTHYGNGWDYDYDMVDKEENISYADIVAKEEELDSGDEKSCPICESKTIHKVSYTQNRVDYRCDNCSLYFTQFKYKYVSGNNIGVQ